jgi:YVTN family beta-propeller protein
MRRAICYALLLTLVSCNVSQPTPTLAEAAKEEKGRFVLYFNGPAKTPENITLEMVSVDAVREDGEKFSVLSQPLKINAVDVVNRQLLLAETLIPLGKYKALHLGIARAQVRREGEWVDLSVPPEGFTIEVEFEVKQRKATPLFMTWDVERAIEGEAFLSPAFAFQGRARELRGVITYVTNEGSDTVSVIDRSVDRVVDVIEVGKGPKGIAISPERETSRALVVNSSFPTLTVIDISDNQVLRNVNLESAGKPSDVAITPDGRTVYVANTALNTVSALESVSFLTEASIQVGRKPVALAMEPGGNRLFVANQAEDTVSVIDTRLNQVTATVSVEFQPIWVAVDRLGNEAFVAHRRSRRVSVISLTTLRVSRTVNIGFAAAVLPDVIGARVFAALFRRNRVSLYNVNLNAELNSVAVEKDPHRLAVDGDRGKLYVVNRGSDTVTVIDRDTLRVRTTIPVGKRPYGIAIVQ